MSHSVDLLPLVVELQKKAREAAYNADTAGVDLTGKKAYWNGMRDGYNGAVDTALKLSGGGSSQLNKPEIIQFEKEHKAWVGSLPKQQ